MSSYRETPMILRETSAGYCTFGVLDEMFRNRELECVGEINDQSVYSLCRQLRYLQREDPQGEITLYINSPGGEVHSGLALYDVMQAISCPIRTVCLGKAASMGAILFAAGDRRDILPHGQVMIHDPLISKGPGGSALAVQEVSKNLLKTRRSLCDILARHTGKIRQEIYRKTAKDTLFSAEEAVSFGLADRIIETL